MELILINCNIIEKNKKKNVDNISNRYTLSQGGGGFSFADNLDAFGNVWYVSRKNAVISYNNVHAINFNAGGQSFPFGLTQAKMEIILRIINN